MLLRGAAPVESEGPEGEMMLRSCSLFVTAVFVCVSTLAQAQSCVEPQNLVVSYDCAGDVATIAWDPDPDHASFDVVRDDGIGGVVTVAVGLPAGTVLFADVGPGFGSYVYTVIATCSSSGTSSATVGPVQIIPEVVPAGESDLILHLEGQQSEGDLGDVNSGVALEAALVASGRAVLRLAPADLGQLLAAGCLDLGIYSSIWVLGGTFPEDYRLNLFELNQIADAAFDGACIYFESADHWGFLHVDSNLDLFDGIEPDTGPNIADGDDTFTAMDGVDSGLGLDLSVDFGGDDGPDMMPGTVDDTPGAVYGQDQAGGDFTDRLSVTGTDPLIPVDSFVFAAAAIWRNSFDDMPAGDPDDADDYITGVFAINNTSVMISTSWEFGGFNLDPLNPFASDADRAQLLNLYLSALACQPPHLPFFIRGDVNSDGVNNVADAVSLLDSLFPGPNPPMVLDCLDASDANNDGAIDISDVVALLGSLFGAATMPLPAPNPLTGCGDDSGMSLGCLASTPPC